jgi:hypothetical protein
MTRSIIASLFSLIVLIAVPGAHSDEIVAGPFSAGRTAGGPPLGWQLKDIKGKTRYTVIDEEGTTVLRAESNGSASGLFRDADVDPKKYPLMEWKWKVARVPSSANEREKNKDDCAARVFVLFKDQLPGAGVYSRLKHKLEATFSSIVPPGVAICYAWGSKLGKDQVIESPYTEWVRIFAVESGPEKAGQWVSEQRNVFEDFKRIFGKEPEKVVGVGIMTDMDQTGESMTAFYRNIVFKSVQ